MNDVPDSASAILALGLSACAFREECGIAALGCAKAFASSFGTKLKARPNQLKLKDMGSKHTGAVQAA
jgi:hypothetical protein